MILEFLKDYWFLITFCISMLFGIYKTINIQKEATKCSLRNDILDIYDRCKSDKKITHYELESIEHSYELYKRLKGNSFVEEVVSRVKDFELID